MFVCGCVCVDVCVVVCVLCVCVRCAVLCCLRACVVCLVRVPCVLCVSLSAPQVTGRPLDVKLFLKYLTDKYTHLYGL